MGRHGEVVEKDEYLPLFETKEAKGRRAFKLYCLSVVLGVCSIFAYRVIHIPKEGERGRWAWMLMFAAELWFSFYWVFIVTVRWKPVYRSTFKDRLVQRYGDQLPAIDIFVCTADPKMEPPLMVINTVLSMMSYNYPSEKISVYLSDDGGSDLTFYALLEGYEFSKHWIPFSKKFNIEPRSPAAYFAKQLGSIANEEFLAIKKLYEEMELRIESATKLGRISEEIRAKHKGFSHWGSSYSSSKDHESIVQILTNENGGGGNDVDIHGHALPTLVYIAREKRPTYNHKFKAGAMNSLIRVSSKISDAQIILNVDCDMYSNNSESLKDALCFFMDKEKGHQVAFLQFPQCFDNITLNDVYSNSLMIISEVDFPGLDAYGGPMYIGTGCFHRRDTLCGTMYDDDKEKKFEWNRGKVKKFQGTVAELQDIKSVTSCTFEENTQWGKEVGLKYGCPVEDVLTGISIQCRGWKSMYYNPTQKAFLGNAPTTLAQTLVQHKRWTEGDFQIFLSKYNPFIFGRGMLKLGHQMGYCVFLLWVPNCLATLCYLVLPPHCLLKGISLFPMISSPWVLPFAYVFIATNAYSLGEFLWFGCTSQGWWNDQRMWMYKRSTSYLLALVDTLFKVLGFSNLKFDLTAKVSEHDVVKRYELELMEFGTYSSMFTILAVLALLNLFALVQSLKRLVFDKETIPESLLVQLLLCGLIVIINLPLFQGLFLRKDKGSMPTSLTFKSLLLAILAYTSSLY